MKYFSFITFLVFTSSLFGQTVWDGEKIIFTKEDGADWNLQENQDRITDVVWITRKDNQGLFNIVAEDSFSGNVSPSDTEWAFGTTEDISTLSFNNFNATSNPMDAIGLDMVVHLISDDIYIDIKILSFSGGMSGGGFSYERSTEANANNNDAILWTGEPIIFTKPDSSDWLLEENQDRITDKVWITRKNQQGFFNIADEDAYDSTISPKDTEWAYGSMDQINSLEFKTWKETTVMPQDAVGKDMVLHLISENIYIEFKLIDFTGMNQGGGFVYQRSTDQTSSITEIEENKKLIYPNPVIDQLNVETNGFSKGGYIYDLTGRLIHQIKPTADAALEIEFLQSGVYILNTPNLGSIKFIKL